MSVFCCTSSTSQANSTAARPPPGNRFERHPKLTLAILLALLLIGSVATVETGLRLLKDRLELRLKETGQARFLRIREWAPGTTRTFGASVGRSKDPAGPVEKEYELRIDQAGFIWPSIMHAQPDLEIVFLGGSTTECLYVRPHMRFPHLTGRFLEQRTELKINSINAGKSGNNTMHALVNYLGKIVPRRPRYVVLMEATNDIGILNAEKTYWNTDKSRSLVIDEESLDIDGPLVRFFRNAVGNTIPYTAHVASAGIKELRARLRGILSPAMPDAGRANGNRDVAASDGAQAAAHDEAGIDLREARRRELVRQFFEPALRSFVRLAKAWGSEPVLMTQVRVDRHGIRNYDTDFLSPEALRRGNFDRAKFGSLHDYANAIIKHVAATEGAVLIDLAAARRWTDRDTYDGLHFTETGSRHAAEIIAQALTPLLPVQAP